MSDFSPYAPPAEPESYRPISDMSSGMLAGLDQRLFASLIDGILTVVFGGIGVGFGMAVLDFDIAGDSELLLQGIAMLAVLPFAMFQWYLIAKSGQTVGKKALKIRIVRLNGEPVGFMHGVVLRNWILGFASFFVSCVGIIDVLFIFRQDRRCVHDLIADTRVVQVLGTAP